MDADEQLRSEIAADLVRAIHFALARDADPSQLSGSRIVKILAALEIERRRVAEDIERRRLSEQAKAASHRIRMPFSRRA